MEITANRLRFSHKCIKENDDEFLTPLQKFMKSDQYKEILKRQKVGEIEEAEPKEALQIIEEE